MRRHVIRPLIVVGVAQVALWAQPLQEALKIHPRDPQLRFLYGVVMAEQKRTDDAIVQRDIAPSQTAGAAIFDNVGVVSNKGLEVSLNARLLDNKFIQYDAQVEGSWNKNRLESLAPGIEPFGAPLV